MSRGHDRERRLRDRLHETGWWTTRAAGSLGDADVVALKRGWKPMMVEVKSTSAGPYHGFGPARRMALRLAAQKAGAEAWLVWWPPRTQPQWIPESEWPPARARGKESGASRRHADHHEQPGP